MQIRPAKPEDLDRMLDVDGTIESLQYLHVDRAGEGLAMTWRLEERALRQKHTDAFPMDDESRFLMRQIATGADEGMALVAEHEGTIVASMLAQPQHAQNTLRLIDLRVDYDHRRQGLGSVLLYRSIQEARDRELRAVTARTLTNNVPAARFLQKAAFDLGGLDLQYHSNHDLVKEAVSLIWYASLD